MLTQPLTTTARLRDRITRSANAIKRPTPLVLFAATGLSVLSPLPARAQSVEWNQQGGDSDPSARYLHAMVYDAARGVAVLFGGYTDAYDGETWEWNGSDGGAWTNRAVSGPSPRSWHAMAYDAARGVTVLFGGGATGTNNDETWEWNGTAWTQRMVNGPSPRSSHAMAYDAVRGVTVLFGGYTGTRDGETWEWNGTVWTQRFVSGPSPRWAHAMAYDAARGVTVLFGGLTTTRDSQTWEWNGTDWTQLLVNGPSGRYGHAMAYDVARGVTVLFGGVTGSNANGTPVTNGETWEWDGTIWTRRFVSGPSPRWAHAMAYDATHAETFLFGGRTVDDVNGETWGLRTTCAADFNGDGSVGFQDFADLLAAFFAGDLSADVNHDTVINSQDFFDFLATFLAGC